MRCNGYAKSALVNLNTGEGGAGFSLPKKFKYTNVMADKKQKDLVLSEAEIDVILFIRENRELAEHLRNLHDWAIHFNVQDVEQEQKTWLYYTNRLGRLIEGAAA